MILITGATGHLGKAVIDQLVKRIGVAGITAFVRSEEKAGELKAAGIRLAIGSFDDTTSLDAAMQGIEKVLLISTIDQNRLHQHKNVVDAATKAGVKHIGYTGVSLTGLEQAAGRQLMESHFGTEDHIKASGLGYSFFRNTLYLDYIPVFVGEQALEHGISLPAGDGKVPFVLRREMGEAIANVLGGDTTGSNIYEIVNSELYSFQDVADELSAGSGKKVAYQSPEPEAFLGFLKSVGVPEENAQMAAAFATDIREHRYEQTSQDLEKLLGRKPSDLKAGLKEVYKF